MWAEHIETLLVTIGAAVTVVALGATLYSAFKNPLQGRVIFKTDRKVEDYKLSREEVEKLKWILEKRIERRQKREEVSQHQHGSRRQHAIS